MINGVTAAVRIAEHSSSGGTIYVDNTAPYCAPSTYDTIQAAVDAASAGDTVFVCSGTYHETVWINKSDLKLYGENKSTTIIDGEYTRPGGFNLSNANNVEIVGFTISKTSNHGIYVHDLSSATIANNTIHHNGYGIYVRYSSSATITDNVLSNNEISIFAYESSSATITGNEIFYSPYGIDVRVSSNATITDNTIHHNSLYGVAVSEFSSASIAHNTISNNSFDGIAITDSSRATLTGNDISDNDFYGLYVSRLSNTTITNNTISDNWVTGVVIWNSSATVHHNCIINNTVQAYDNKPLQSDWHHPVLLEGNYWSDYQGVDDGSGTGKHAIAGDGIGDTLIPHPGANYDYYPFIECGRWLHPVNMPPVADAGPDQTVNEGDAVQFDGSGSYDPDNGIPSWKVHSNISVPRMSLAAAAIGQEIYALGGSIADEGIGPGIGYPVDTVEVYGASQDLWYEGVPLPSNRSQLAAATVSDRLYAMGGMSSEMVQPFGALDLNEEYDPATGQWVSRASIPTPRAAFDVAVVDGKVFAIGGYHFMPMSFYRPLNVVEVYDPATDSWTNRSPMPTNRSLLAVAALDRKIYAIGGVDARRTVEVYDVDTDTWSTAKEMPLAPTGEHIRGITAEAYAGRIYVMGGYSYDCVSSAVISYDPKTDRWRWEADMNHPRAYLASVTLGNAIYAVGGTYGWMCGNPEPAEKFEAVGELSFEWDFDANVDLDGDGNYTNDKEATDPTPSYTYYDDGIYTVTLTVTEAQGLQGMDQCNITVLNVPPTPEWTSRSLDGTIPNPPYPEGKEILFEATVYDPGIYDTFTYDWDFGDGTVLLDTGPSAVHAYGDNDTYIVVLTVTDDDGGVGIDDTPPLLTTNENPVPSISLPFCIFLEGTTPCEAIGEFSDPGWLDTHSAVWNYGDGTYEIAVLTEENDPPDATGMNITSHIYGDNGVYNITFTVVDDDGGVGSDWADAYVQNLPPFFSFDAPASVKEGESFLLEIVSTDPGSDDIILTVDWGDGTSETETFYNNGIGPDPPNSGQGVWPFTVYLNSTHVYGDNGNFTITITVEDDDGGSVQDSTEMEVINLPPEIALPMIPLIFGEGEEFTLVAVATDPGSDDIEFSWTFELGPSISTIYYNDGVGPDPPLSPWGTFPFIAEDTVAHTYGDNGHYNVTITATDDDGGVATSLVTIEVRNVEPSIDMGGPYAGDENSPIEFTATAVDPGSDDLTFIWDWSDGTTDATVFYNDGINPDPPKSPWGTYPFEATHTISHIWGDNGDFTVTLTVMDDDGSVTVQQTVVTVSNVAPTIESIQYYLNASFAFRIAGEKWHNVEIHLYEDGTEIGYANITRYPGSPNDQMATLGDVSIDFSKTFSAIAYYTPEDDPVNGQIWGANPAWVIIQYDDGEERIHHTFNVRHEDTWTWVIDDLSPYFLGHNITFVATASDPGSDDLIFTWNWGDGNTTEHIYYNDGIGPDPYPSPEVNPIAVTDTAMHAYALAGTYTVTLTVTDDDGGQTTISIVPSI